jgi:hypothetical protein
MPDVSIQLRDYLDDIAPPPFEVAAIIDRAEAAPVLAPVPPPRRRRPWAVGLATAIATLVLVGGGALILRLVGTNDLPVVDEPTATTAPPVTTGAPAPTTAVPSVTEEPQVAPAPAPSPTTTTPIAAAPEPTMTWIRLSDESGVFGGPGMQNIRDLVAGGPGFIAVGADDSGGDNDAAVWYSSDGLAWTRVPHDPDVFGGPGHQAMWAIAAGGPGFVAVGADGIGTDRVATGAFEVESQSAAVWYSSDGIEWHRAPNNEALTVGDGAIAMTDVVAGGPGFVAVGYRMHMTNEVLAWSDFNTDFTNEPIEPIFHDLDAVVWISSDGVTWDRVTHDDSVFGGDDVWHDMKAITAGGPGFVAVGAQGFEFWGPSEDVNATAAVWTSADGVTWTRIPHSESLDTRHDVGAWATMYDVAAGGPGLVAVGYDIRNIEEGAVWTSVDGSTWTRVVRSVFNPVDPFYPRMTGILAAGDTLVAVGGNSLQGGTMLKWYSVDGGDEWFRQTFVCTASTGAGPGIWVGSPRTGHCATETSIVHGVIDGGAHILAFGTTQLGATDWDATVWIATWDEPLE